MKFEKPNKTTIALKSFFSEFTAIWYPKNFFLCTKYPFLKYHDWTGGFIGYKFTWYDEIPEGWRIAFGRQFLKDLVNALREDKIPKYKWRKALYFGEIKEKWGRLTISASTTHSVYDVLNKYEDLSMKYCIHCGKTVSYRTKGWVTFICKDCAQRLYKEQDLEEVEK